MVMAAIKVDDDYWDSFEVHDQDIEYLYNYLLETETPLTSDELLLVLLNERIHQEKISLEAKRSQGAQVYLPKGHFQQGEHLVLPSLDWKKGEVIQVRNGKNPDIGAFEVIKIKFENGEEREFASGLEHHPLNILPEEREELMDVDVQEVVQNFGEDLIERIEVGLKDHSDFVKVSGKWFPRALLVDVNIGYLNLAEAILDMAGGGPISTTKILEQIEVSSNVNSNLLEFSLNYALQEDQRFDEVGAAGEVMWFLRRLEPEAVLETPYHLRYQMAEENRSLLSAEMLQLEKQLNDELTPVQGKISSLDQVQLSLIYPHWREGTLPLSAQTRNLFPTAYEAPRIRVTIIDGETGDRFQAWVVRPKGYVYGLKEWYEKRGLIPGSIIIIQKGKKPGEVILKREVRRPGREWVRTVLVGSDGGIVFAMLKQNISAIFDERMTIAIPDVEGVDLAWERLHKERTPFEKVVVNTFRELTKLSPQGHVHASELYAAINVMRRCPPGPIFELLVSKPWFEHVGDLHFRYVEQP